MKNIHKSEAVWFSVNELIYENNFEGALSLLDKVASSKIDIHPNWYKIQFMDSYLHIAEIYGRQNVTVPKAKTLVLKAHGLLLSYKKILPKREDVKLLYDSLLARSHSLIWQTKYSIRAIELKETIANSDIMKSIYEIDDNIQKSIVIYRSCLNRSKTDEEVYSNRNNLAVSLSRVGRYVESLSHYQDNIDFRPNNAQSNFSWAQNISVLSDKYSLGNCASIWLGIAKKLFDGLSEEQSREDLYKVVSYMNYAEKNLNEIGFELTIKQINQNSAEEKEDYKEHPMLRQFSLINQLTLTEHALYCNCRDSRSDDLEIKTNSKIGEKLLSIIKSEFAFSRYLLFKYRSNIVDEPDDFTEVDFEGSIIGYKIEHLKQSFKVAYSILDKIGNAIIDFLEIPRIDRSTYFEDIFYHYRQELEPIYETSLCALYSLSLELNQSNGNLRHFKKLRNIMEHETSYRIVKDKKHEFTEKNKEISEKEMMNLTLELLRLTRSAIFSFVFFSRSLDKKASY